ncbi:MAG: dehydrogenase, FAD-containing subunit [Myxococcales bacterium]|nr:dehydrogenase, FAD-containing subunit [Myxococcales bacterium]
MMPHVVVVGGGFGGLEAARRLRNAPVRVTLLDRRNHHLFQPLLYQVATAALSAADIAYPIRSILAKQDNARVLLADVTGIDVAKQTITLDAGTLHYDYLVLATGATHSYFGKDQWATLAPGLKSVEDALEMRRRIYLAYEAAEREADPVEQHKWLTFAVVGGGPTGVELAGALGEIGLHTLAKDFRSIDPTRVDVMLFESKDRVLGTYPEKLSEAAKHSLEQRHVTVRLNTLVTAIDDEGVTVKGPQGEERIGARTVLWAAGVQASPLGAQLGVPRDRSGRVIVEPDLSIPGHPEVFVIGDLARMMSDGVEVPGVAQGALQGGRHVAKIITEEARTIARSGVIQQIEASTGGDGARPSTGGDGASKHAPIDVAARPAFRYHDKGNMATIGRAEAVVATKHIARHGLLAWLVWWVVHIYFLVGFRNRVYMMFHWAWSWMTYRRGSRLITGEIGPLPPVKTIGPHGELLLLPATEPLAHETSEHAR